MLKRAISAGLVVTMLAPAAHADVEPESAPVMLSSYDVLAARTPMPLVAPALELEPKVKEIRLTRGEKIAIIVTACVVGALLLIFAVGKPHKHL